MANSLIVICGPTGTGKTSLGIKLAQKINGEILSADSRQLFKEADIGTNKIDPLTDEEIVRGDGWWIQSGVKIWLYDLVSPAESFSLSDFIQRADKSLADILRRGKTPLLVGGTGFYIDSFLGQRSYATVPPDPIFREKHLKTSERELWQILIDKSPDLSERINQSDRCNRRRLIRYLEILNSGKTLEQSQVYHSLPENLQVVHIGLSGERKNLYHKADLWTDKIISHGLVSETEYLLSQYSSQTPLLQGLIYQPTVSFLRKEIDQEELSQKIKFQLHQYIRRQLVWFKKEKNMVWLDRNDPFLLEKTLSLIR